MSSLLQLGQTNIALPSTGGQLRNYHLAHELARGLAVTHLGFQDQHDPPSHKPLSRDVPITLIPREKPYSLGKLTLGAIGRVPAGLLNFTSQGMTEAVARTLNQADNPYDIVQVEGLEMFPYLRLIRSSR